MKKSLGTELPAELERIPIFTDDIEEVTPAPSFGAFRANELEGSRDALPTSAVDWNQVVELRRLASATFTDQSEDHLREAGRPLSADDRPLVDSRGRSVRSSGRECGLWLRSAATSA